MSAGKIRVLVADDSPTARAVLVAVLGDANLEVCGIARDGFEAVELARQLVPDVAVLDIHMPGIDGVAATRQIMADTPVPVIVCSSTVDVRDVKLALEATRAGAVAAVPKPLAPDEARELVSTVRAMAGLRVVRHHSGTARRRRTTGRPALLAIATSTGGPQALSQILGELTRFPIPIAIVQHIGTGWIAGFSEWLATQTSLPVKVAEAGEPLVAGTVYLAPEDRHFEIAGTRDSPHARITNAPPVGQFRPSGTHLFSSAARVYREAAMGLVLTGMGEDGRDGLRAIYDAGGTCIAQDRVSSIVFGMPGAVIAAGLVDHVVALDAIASTLVALVERA